MHALCAYKVSFLTTRTQVSTPQKHQGVRGTLACCDLVKGSETKIESRSMTCQTLCVSLKEFRKGSSIHSLARIIEILSDGGWATEVSRMISTSSSS